MEPIVVRFETNLPEELLANLSAGSGGDEPWLEWFQKVNELVSAVNELTQQRRKQFEQLAKLRAAQETLQSQVARQQELLDALLEPSARRRAQLQARGPIN